jgi:putative copper resistance protein D
VIAHGSIPPPFGLRALLTQWALDPAIIVLLVAAGGLYLSGVRRLRSGPPHPRSRSIAFYAGLATIAVALLSPVDVYAEVSFSVHMLQHVLLMFVAAPLLLLGAPGTLALRAVKAPTRRRFLLPVVHFGVVATLTHPLVAWSVFAAVQYVTHFTGFYEAALGSQVVHAAEHGLYLTAALLFWWPVVGLDPGARTLSHPARLVYLVLAMPLEAFLGVAILSANSVLYSHYAALPRPWGGPNALADQGNAGAIMWMSGDLVALVAGLLVAAAWFRHDEARQRRIEAELDRAERA